MSQLSEESWAEIRALFEGADADNNNRIDREEFGKLLDALSADMSTEEADIGFEIIDSDNDRGIDLDEFVAWWEDR